MKNQRPVAVPIAQSVTDFPFGEDQIRAAFAENSQVWLCAKDICRALNLTWSGATLQNVPKRWVTLLKSDTESGAQETCFVNEAGCFKLIFRSNKPEAESIADWMSVEVISPMKRLWEVWARDQSQGLH